MSHQAQTPAVRSRPTALLLDLGGVVLDIDPSGCFDSWAKAADTEVAAIAARWAVDDAYKAFEVGAIDFGEYIESLSPRLGITLTRAQWRAGWNELLRGPFTDVVQVLPDIAIPLYAFSNTNPVHQAVWQIQLADCLAKFAERRQRTVLRRLEDAGLGVAVGPDVDVVAEQDVDAVEAEPRQARLQGSPHRVEGVVVADGDRFGVPHPGVSLAFVRRNQEPSNLGGQYEVVAR